MANHDRPAMLRAVHLLLEQLQDAATVEIRPLHGGRALFELPEPARLDPGALDPCSTDILCVLVEAGSRLTTNQVLSALQEANKIWGDSTVRMKLAALVKARVITSDPAAHPPGYAPASSAL